LSRLLELLFGFEDIAEPQAERGDLFELVDQAQGLEGMR
jgi:hypothetical protein